MIGKKYMYCDKCKGSQLHRKNIFGKYWKCRICHQERLLATSRR